MWLNIRGSANYEVNERGEIRHKKFQKVLKVSISDKGYAKVGMRISGTATPRPVHRLVALAFLDNPQNLPHVAHIDGDRLNNRADNLQWRAKGKPAEKISKKPESWDEEVEHGHGIDQRTPYS